MGSTFSLNRVLIRCTLGFLDISKLMEYKPPQEDYNLWTRPRAAQRKLLYLGLLIRRYKTKIAHIVIVVLKNPDQISCIPKFEPAVCAHCSRTIRGAQFRCIADCGRPNCAKEGCLQPYCRQPDQRPVSDRPLLFCETCKRANIHPERHLRKFEKRCILREALPPTRRRRICTCENRPPHIGDDDDDSDDGNDLYFAVDGGYLHQPRCPVFKLKRRHEGVKFQELRRSRTGTQARGTDRSRESRSRVQKAGSKILGSAAQAATPPIQFGNVHMMLMVGTIIIENGVPEYDLSNVVL